MTEHTVGLILKFFGFLLAVITAVIAIKRFKLAKTIASKNNTILKVYLKKASQVAAISNNNFNFELHLRITNISSEPASVRSAEIIYEIQHPINKGILASPLRIRPQNSAPELPLYFKPKEVKDIALYFEVSKNKLGFNHFDIFDFRVFDQEGKHYTKRITTVTPSKV